MNRIIFIKNPFKIYNFIKNVEQITNLKSWVIDGTSKLKMSTIQYPDGTPFWDYFNA